MAGIAAVLRSVWMLARPWQTVAGPERAFRTPPRAMCRIMRTFRILPVEMLDFGERFIKDFGRGLPMRLSYTRL